VTTPETKTKSHDHTKTESPPFKMHLFNDFEAAEEKNAQRGEAAFSPACTIGALIGLHGQKLI
jgi:hypothetical protein